MSLVRSTGEKIYTNYAKMFTYGNIKFSTESTKVENWLDNSDMNISQGKFVCEPNLSRIKIPASSASLVEVGGLICGYGNFMAVIDIIDSDNNSLTAGMHQAFGVLSQSGGNKYAKVALPAMSLKIPDKSKDYYITLKLNGYNEDFDMNSGFGTFATYIYVKQID